MTTPSQISRSVGCTPPSLRDSKGEQRCPSRLKQTTISVVGDAELRAVLDLSDGFKLVFKRGKERIPFHRPLHEGQVEIGTKRQRLLINLRAAADENLTRLDRGIDLAQIRHGPQTGELKLSAAQDDRGAIGQRLAQGFEGFAAHDDDLTGRQLFEPLKILRQAPGDFVAAANHAIERHGREGFEMFHRWKTNLNKVTVAHLFSTVAQTFLSAGSGDFPVPSL